MSTFGERFLFFSTNPRSPIKTQMILKVINKYHLTGNVYDQKLQSDFYKKYTIFSSDKGGNSKDPAFSGRQLLTRAPQALGFIRARSGYPLEISEAGKLLLDDNLYEDILMHQMFKFQLPSPLHHEKKGKNKGIFNIKPFLELTRLVNTLHYLTYKELLIYGMTLTDYHDFDATVDAIKRYRIRRKSVKGSKSLNEFDYQEQLSIFKHRYKDELKNANFKTRESKTNTAEQYMKKKIRNWNDYTDAIFRMLHESGLFVATKKGTLSISPKRQEEVDYLLENIPRKILPESTSREEFDKYMFDPSIPVLLHDDRTGIIKHLTKLNIDFDPNSSLYELKKLNHNYLIKQRKEKVAQIVNNLKERKTADVEDIINTYTLLTQRGVQDAPLRMEWNTWRAITMIDHGKIIGNFTTDDEGNPIHTAGGNQGDIIGKYDKFNIVYEVTMSSGSTQYKMESEPVTRHVGMLQKESNLPTYGVFIAPKLSPTIIPYFYVSAVAKSTEFGGKTTGVIPLSLDDFISFFKAASTKEMAEKELQKLCEYSIQKAREYMMNGKTAEDWYTTIRNNVLTAK